MSYPGEEGERTQRDNNDLEEKPANIFPMRQLPIALQHKSEIIYLSEFLRGTVSAADTCQIL
jgi:hypothetical protein